MNKQVCAKLHMYLVGRDLQFFLPLSFLSKAVIEFLNTVEIV